MKLLDTIQSVVVTGTAVALCISAIITAQSFVSKSKTSPGPLAEQNISVSIQAYKKGIWYEVVELRSDTLTVGVLKNRQEGRYRLVTKQANSTPVVTNLYKEN